MQIHDSTAKERHLLKKVADNYYAINIYLRVCLNWVRPQRGDPYFEGRDIPDEEYADIVGEVKKANHAVAIANARVTDKTSTAHLAYLALASYLKKLMSALDKWNEMKEETWRPEWTEVFDKVDAFKDDAGRFSRHPPLTHYSGHGGE